MKFDNSLLAYRGHIVDMYVYASALMEAYLTSVLWSPDGRWSCGFCSVQAGYRLPGDWHDLLCTGAGTHIIYSYIGLFLSRCSCVLMLDGFYVSGLSKAPRNDYFLKGEVFKDQRLFLHKDVRALTVFAYVFYSLIHSSTHLMWEES